MAYIRKASTTSRANIAKFAADDSGNDSANPDYNDSDGDMYEQPALPDKVVSSKGSGGKVRQRPRLYADEGASTKPIYPFNATSMGPPNIVNNAAAFFTPQAPLNGSGFSPLAKEAYPGLIGAKRPGAARRGRPPADKMRKISNTVTPSRSKTASLIDNDVTPNGFQGEEEYYNEVGSFMKTQQTPMVKDRDVIGPADQYLYEGRMAGHTYEALAPTYMALSGIKSVGSSTLPNRFARLQMIKALWSPEEDAALQRAVVAVESAYKFHKWTFVKKVMEEDGFGPSRRTDGRVFDGEAMRRRWEVIMELEGTSMGTSVADEGDLSMRSRRRSTSTRNSMVSQRMYDGDATEDDEEYMNGTKDEVHSDPVDTRSANGVENHDNVDIEEINADGAGGVSESVTRSTSRSDTESVIDGDMIGIEHGGADRHREGEHDAVNGMAKQQVGVDGAHEELSHVNGVREKNQKLLAGVEHAEVNDAVNEAVDKHAATDNGEAMEM